MNRYHIDPEGNAGPCNAQIKCPFGDFESEHYNTIELARKAFETKMEAYTLHLKGVKVYKAKSFSDRSTEEMRLNADSYWTSPQDHKDHYSKFVEELNAGCLYCGTKENVFLNEHLYSANRGGITAVGNIGPSCEPCNKSKGNMSAKEYFKHKLSNPDYSHPIFDRDEYKFNDLLDRYSEPFRTEYPDEYDLAIREENGDPTAIEEIRMNAIVRYMDWQHEVFPPANGDNYTRAEEIDFRLKLARGEFTTRKPSTFDTLKDSEDPIEREIYERAAKRDSKGSDTARHQANAIASSAMNALNFARTNPPPTQEEVSIELSKVWNSSETRNSMIFVFKNLGYNTSKASVDPYL